MRVSGAPTVQALATTYRLIRPTPDSDGSGRKGQSPTQITKEDEMSKRQKGFIAIGVTAAIAAMLAAAPAAC